MELRIDGLSKRYVSHWVFRNLTASIQANTHFAITGPNGSGKSTLLKILSGALHPSEGTVTYRKANKHINADSIFSQISFAAPYAEMIEEMTIPEALRFHSRFRVFYQEVAELDAFCASLEFEFRQDQQIQFMSSGMKQRLRLAFAMGTRSSVLLLDEPSTNLDSGGVQWFHRMLSRFGTERTVVISSNARADLVTCTQQLHLGQQDDQVI